MLRSAESNWSVAEEDASFSAELATGAAVAAPPVYLPAGRYGAMRTINKRAVAITLLFHAVLLAALLHIREERVRAPEHRITTVNLQPPAPPPPPENKPSPPAKSPIVAPVPRIQTPRPAPPMVTTAAEPVPEPVSIPAVARPAPPAPPAPPSVVKDGDLGARMIAGKPPRYPLESRRRHEEGTVVLALTLDADGRVASISVVRSSGFARLDDAALHAVRHWRWQPVMRGGQAVMVKGLVEIPFLLRG